MNCFTKIALCVAVLAITSRIATAQTYRNSIGLSIGTFHLRTLDQQASPLRYVGTISPQYGFTYRYHTDRSQFNLRFSGGAGTMNPERFGARTYTTKFGDGTPYSYQISSEFFHVNVEADYLQRIGPAEPGRLTTWVGGSIHESLLYGDEVANFPWLVNTATVSPVVQTDYAFGAGHSLTLRIDIAAVGLITRAIWASFPKSIGDNNVIAYVKQGTHRATVNKLGNTNVQLGYSYRVSPRISVGATYRARYLTYPDPRPIRALTSSLSLEGEVHF
ncbi:hypothetical protein IC229_20725 [Spirosoma sp. BT702]|uniref:Outer membrane protein beta-barrel domain-containing protein n=1 Tax=Spirosoma profusum TaxID=2771354 RepID=A0A926XY48_9BACT|nr:hypothetical protein [Spirosoma profusum]MBD2703084.1 hypothetical protein [Spirosoma profusum]